MSSDIAISIRGLGKCYYIYDRPEDRLKQALWRWHRKFYREFWALKDVSFDVGKGEIIGIVGRNGSGKSTLLQMICGTLAPTSGEVHLMGRVAALLELGSGFNPEFTGRENVYMSASVLGLSREEIDRKYEAILSFADIGNFIEQPVKTYSSGMYMRLAFAVAISVDPDILIIDEALSVGDVKFQAKCFRRFEDLVARGTTILFVTHSIEQITRICHRAILIDAGSLVMNGSPKDVTNRYLDLLFGIQGKAPQPTDENNETRSPLDVDKVLAAETLKFEERPGYNSHEYRWGSREAEIMDFMVTTTGGLHQTNLPSGVETLILLRVRFHRAVAAPIFGLTVKTPDGVIVYGCNSRDFADKPLVRSVAVGETVRIVYRLDQRLAAGDYLLSVGVAEEQAGKIVPLDRRYDSIHITVASSTRCSGLADFKMQVEVASA